MSDEAIERLNATAIPVLRISRMTRPRSRPCPRDAWTAGLQPDGTATDEAQVAEVAGLNRPVGNWIDGLRLIVRRTTPAARHAKNRTALEKRTGWRYTIVATNIHGVPVLTSRNG
jgi:hypothetical protein